MAKVRSVTGRTDGQVAYIKTINSHPITICHGPAGSGKTHIAAALAAWMFAKDSNPVEKIILCRPVVDCGQSIGFLPGTADEKVGPYLAPLFDELGHYFKLADINSMMDSKEIQIVPLSMMRGRTFNNSFVILDEAQNATTDELKMLLTRIGIDSKMVLAGDSTQSDLGGTSDFEFATRILEHINEIGVCRLGLEDIVRNKLNAKIITAFDRAAHVPPVATNDFVDYDEEEFEEVL